MNPLSTSLKRVVKNWVPPALVRALRRGPSLGFTGNYPDWTSAKNDCSGYDHPSILEVVAKSTMAVIEGTAAFERDSVLFDKPEYNWPLLAALQNILRREENTLSLVDFGGSLGSTYRQCLPFLDGASKIEWCVIEQPEFVERGRRIFGKGDLSFQFDLEAALSHSRPTTILLSSVLQYIEDPFLLMRKIVDLDFKYVIIDRTPISIDGRSRIVKQIVPPEIYAASYPARIFTETQIQSPFSSRYQMKAEFTALDNFDEKSRFKGFLYERLDVADRPAGNPDQKRPK